MSRQAPIRLLAATALLLLVAGGLLAREWLSSPEPLPTAVQFQDLVGGLGVGPAVDLSHGEFSFDPRLAPGGPEVRPVLGEPWFSDGRGTSILYLEIPRPDGELPSEEPAR